MLFACSCSKGLSKLKSGKECDSLLHSLAELIFDGMIVVLLAFYSEAFCVFFPLWKHDYLLNDVVGCHSKVFGASSIELCCIYGIGNFNLSLLCITKISDRFCIVSAFQADLFFAIYL